MALPNARAFTIIWTNLQDAWTSELRNGGGSPSSFAKVDKIQKLIRYVVVGIVISPT